MWAVGLLAGLVMLGPPTGVGAGPLLPVPDSLEADSLADPAGDRLFFNSTARFRPRGTGVVGSYGFLLVPHVGITPLDGFQVGLGLPMPGLLSGGGALPSLVLGGKVRVLDAGAVKAAVSGLRMGGGGREAIYVGQGIVTVEGPRVSATAALARIWKDRRSGAGSVLTLGGQLQAGPGVRLMAESHVLFYENRTVERTLFVGPRFVNGRAAVDVAAWIPLEEGQGPAMPVVNLAWTW